MRFHLLGLAHLPTTREYQSCAFTQKIVKLARMLKSLGHHVIFYGAEGSDVECDESVVVLSAATLKRVYGDYDWKAEQFRHDPKDEAYREFNARAVDAIRARQAPGDFLLCPMGSYQQPVADKLENIFVVESGIGYGGTFAPYRVYESYAWMHWCYGRDGFDDGRWYDAVIPNAFDPADFKFRNVKDDYFLFLGRVVIRKGLSAAIDTCRAVGARLIVAGQMSAEGVDLSDPCVEFVGYADAAKRRKLLAGARALLAPTYYVEPFGGVAVEAMLSGTPVITTDWGAFSETVLHGVTGYRCRNLDEFVAAARGVDELSRYECREWARNNYSLSRVAEMYQEYFTRLSDLRGDGWYARRPERRLALTPAREFP